MPWHEIGEGYRAELLDYYRTLGRIRLEEPAFDGGNFYFIKHSESAVVYVREKGDSRIIVAVNRGEKTTVELPEGAVYRDLISGEESRGSFLLEGDRAVILKETIEK
jgi:glycosidase